VYLNSSLVSYMYTIGKKLEALGYVLEFHILIHFFVIGWTGMKTSDIVGRDSEVQYDEILVPLPNLITELGLLILNFFY